MVQPSGSLPNSTKVLGSIPAWSVIPPLIHHNLYFLYEWMKNRLNDRLRAASGQHSFHVISHSKQLHSSVLLFFLQEGEKDPPETAETLNTSRTTTLQTGRRKRKVPRFIPSLRSATMLLISLKPSICQPVCVLGHMIWSDKGHPLQETTALLFVGDNRALQARCGFKTNGLCCLELQLLMSSITFEAKKFPVCVPGEQSNDVCRSTNSRSCF